MPQRRRSPATQHEDWHVDKNIPLAYILALLVQAAAIIWWGSGVTKDVEDLKNDVRTLTQKAERRDDKIDGLGQMKGELRSIAGILTRLERTVERLQFPTYARERFEDRRRNQQMPLPSSNRR